MIDEYQKKYRIPSLTTDAVVLRKHKNDDFHDILLVTRGNYPEEGKLAFPGGFVEYGEDPEQGCLRELKEETELIGKDIELLTVRGNPNRDPRRHVVSIIYTVNVDPDAQPIGGDDARDAKFYDLKDIIENKKAQIAFDHYGVIEELIGKKFSDLYNKKIVKNTGRLKSGNNNNIINNAIKVYLAKIEKLQELNELSVKKKELELCEKEIEQLYDAKLEDMRKKIDEITKEKWQIFEERNNKMREIKSKREKLEKTINLPYNGGETKLKSKKQQQKKSISISTENDDIKNNNKEIKLENSNNYTIKTNTTNNTVLSKVKQVLDKTVKDVKKVAKENIMSDTNEINKREQIEKIKKITSETIDEINRLTKYIVDQSNILIEKINGKDFNKITFKAIKKDEKRLCKKCSSDNSNYDDLNCKDKKKHIVHRGIRCNGCGNFIWDN